MSVQPGWYKDPADPSTQRYWDGEGWVGAPLPADATPPSGPPVTPEPAGAPATGGTGPSASAAPLSPAAPPAAGRPLPPGGPLPPVPPFPSATPIPPAGQTRPISPPVNGSDVPESVPSPTPAGPPPGPPPPGWPHPPYAHPSAPRPHGLALAPLGARLVARLIDIGVVLLLNVVVNRWFVWQWVHEVSPLFAEAWRRSLAGDRSAEGLPQPDQRADSLVLVILLLAAALWFAYEVPALANGGQTLGKRLVGVKVVPLTGEQRLGFGRALRRWNTLGLPVFLWYCCGIGFLLQLIDCAYPLFDRPLRQALHDKRAQTVVVQVPRSPATPAGTRSGDRTETPGGSA